MLVDEPRTLGTALVEINGLTHVAICGKDPATGEGWSSLSCYWTNMSRTVQPGHVDRLAFPTCLWCVAEDDTIKRAHRGPG